MGKVISLIDDSKGKRVLLVLAGEPPSEKLLFYEYNSNDLRIAVDGGANVFLKSGLPPDLIIGDFDSENAKTISQSIRVHRPDQTKTDLQKALNYLFENYSLAEITLLGATGGRTDHLINNMQICASVDPRVSIRIIHTTNISGRQCRETIYRVTKYSNTDPEVTIGSTLSVFAVNEFAGFSSMGLKWDISDAQNGPDIVSQSNITIKSDPQFKLHSGCVYIAVYQ